MGALEDGLVRLFPRLRRFAWTLTRDWPDADDLTQSSVTRALERSSHWQSGTPLDAWMYRLMRNVWIDETRKRAVRKGRGQEDAMTSPQLVAAQDTEDQTYAAQVLSHIGRLPEGFGSVLLLVAVEGHSYQETADILGIPVGTVMSRLSAARRKLRQSLNDGGRS